MSKPESNDNWAVHPHAAVEKLESNLWRVEGNVPNMPLKRVMTVARLENGELIIYNPIALEEPQMRELEAWGKPAYLIVPNRWHKLDAGRFAARYPEAKLIAPTQGRDKVQQIVARTAGPEQLPSQAEVSVAELDGTNAGELFMTVRSGARTTLVVADAIFNMPHLRGVHGFLLRHVTRSSGGPCVSRVSRALLIKDKPAFAQQLRRLATPELVRIVVAHHELITHEPAQTLERLAASI